jgi:hypothetical protein
MTIETEFVIDQERRIASSLPREALEERYVWLVRSMFEKDAAVKELFKSMMLGDVSRIHPP